MSDASNPALLRQALLARLRFERAMGIESIHPVALEAAPVSAPPPSPAPAIATPSAPSIALRAATPAKPAPVSAPPVPRAEAAPPKSATPADKAQRWRILEAKAMACTACALSKGRTNVVFGTGNRNAELVFVGEGPGFDEDQQGIPFVGRAGQFLDKIIAAMKLKREDLYICNVVKCRPPENRTPLPDEIAACWPYLNEQIELIAPKVIVTLGAPATKTLLKTTQGIMALRGRWFAFNGITVMPTFHPAFVLRSYTEENRRAVWEDMKKVMAKLKGE